MSQLPTAPAEQEQPAIEPAIEPAKQNQAQRIINKFGGARNLYRALLMLPEAKHRNPSSIYRWSYIGHVPSAAMADVMEAARLEGIFLTDADLHPGTR